MKRSDREIRQPAEAKETQELGGEGFTHPELMALGSLTDVQYNTTMPNVYDNVRWYEYY